MVIYNWLQFFQCLPFDIQRLIFEYDDTYRTKFTTSVFKNELQNRYWNRELVVQTIRELVYQRLESLLKTNEFWNPRNGIFYIMNGRMIASKNYMEIRNIREEVYVYVNPYKHYLRWKLIPFASNLALYDETKMMYDGFIGDKSECKSKEFHTMFFGDGRMEGNHIRILDTPEWCKHIGDTYWS